VGNQGKAMELYVANVTEQNFIFNWREPEVQRFFSIEIPAGSQIHVLKGKTREVVEDVIAQHKKYSIVDLPGAKNATREGKKIYLVYSTKDPLPYEVYELVQEVNDDIAADQIQLNKEKAAYAFGKMIEQDMSGLKEGIKEVELEIIEETPKDPTKRGRKTMGQKFVTPIKK
jgi:hypothetical protein